MTAAATSPSRRPRLPKGEGRQLRDEILAVAERMLLETGSQEAVSIRAVADAVGVTPPSIGTSPTRTPSSSTWRPATSARSTTT
jgi:AcrR family transcriptional regulator